MTRTVRARPVVVAGVTRDGFVGTVVDSGTAIVAFDVHGAALPRIH
jgi:hypothetical protein